MSWTLEEWGKIGAAATRWAKSDKAVVISHEERLSNTEAVLALQGYTKLDQFYQGQHYRAEITDRPTLEVGVKSARPAYIIRYFNGDPSK